MIITREYLTSLLTAWQQNIISVLEFYRTVEQLFDYDETEFIDWEETETVSVTHEVLAYLECLDIDFITQDDIEPCKEFLRTPIGQFDQGYKKWQNYLSTINHQERFKRLKGQDPYIP